MSKYGFVSDVETEGTGPESPRQRKMRVKSIARTVRECRRLQDAINRYGYNVTVVKNVDKSTVKTDFSEAVNATQSEAYQKLLDMPKGDILEALV